MRLLPNLCEARIWNVCSPPPSPRGISKEGADG